MSQPDPTQIAHDGLQADLADFIGWVRDFLDYNTLRAFMATQGRHCPEGVMAHWRNYERDPLGFLTVWGGALAAYYLEQVWPGRGQG